MERQEQHAFRLSAAACFDDARFGQAGEEAVVAATAALAVAACITARKGLVSCR